VSRRGEPDGDADAGTEGRDMSRKGADQLADRVTACLVLMPVLTLMALALALAGPVSSAAAATKAWTVMVYLDGDNSLEDYVTLDIRDELSALGSNADVNVVCIADRCPGLNTTYGDWTDTRLFYCTQGLEPYPENAVAAWGERDMGDPQTLADFVTWTKTNYPADHYLIAFWDHGYLWWPNYSNISDSTSGDTLDDDEQVDAMAVAGAVDVVAWDCCQRQMVEIAANWQPYAKMMAGSEEYTNWEGVQYDKVIAAIRATPTMTAQQVSDTIATTATGDSLTFSSVALDERFDALLAAIDQWAIALRNGLPAYKSDYDAAWRSTQTFTEATDKDLCDAALQIKAKVTDATIDATCDALVNAVQDAVTVNWTSGNRQVAGAHGIAIWWPKTATDLQITWNDDPVPIDDWLYYRTEMALAPRTAWGSFIGASSYGDYAAPATTDNHDALAHHTFALVLSATDAGSGVYYTEYRIDGGAWKRGARVALAIAIKHKRGNCTRGSHLVEYRSVDNAGNVESTHSCTVILG
jgi:hypothetical protein